LTLPPEFLVLLLFPAYSGKSPEKFPGILFIR
jgi:hypothetical protein